MILLCNKYKWNSRRHTYEISMAGTFEAYKFGRRRRELEKIGEKAFEGDKNELTRERFRLCFR